MKAFITGSYAYGTPTKESDIDLVVFIDEEQAGLLDMVYISNIGETKLSDRETEYESDDTYCMRFGKLNLIVCFSKDWYDAWKSGTNVLIEKSKIKKVTRGEAKTHFEILFDMIRNDK